MREGKTLKYLIAVMIYGTIGYFLHFINCASEFVVMCRGFIGSLFILFVMIIKKDYPDISSIKKNFLMLALSGIALGSNWIFLFAGYRYAISITSLLNYLAPIIVVVISALFYKNKMSNKQIVYILMAVVGIVLISGIVEGESNFDYHCFVYGLLAAIGFVILVLCNRNIHDIKPLDKTVVQLFFSFLTVLPVVIFRNLIPTSLDGDSIRILVMMGVVHTGIAYILYFGSIDTLPLNTVAILGYIEPVMSIVIGVVVFNETLTVVNGIGALLILVSALLNEIKSKS